MSNVLLAYNNRADEATLTGGSWSGTLPLTNLQTRVLSKPARSSSAASANTTFDFALAKDREVRVLALCRHNFSQDAQYRIRAWSDAGHTDLRYDSGTVDVWPGLFDSLSLLWEADNFWSGKLAPEDQAGFFWNLLLVLSSAIVARYWRVEIFDTTNSAGYVEIGRLFVAAGWQPGYNMSYGARLGYNSRREIEEAWDGTEYFSVQQAYRTAQFALDWISESEAMSAVLDMQRVCDVAGEVLYCWNPSDTAYAIRRSFLGRMKALNPVEHPYVETWKTSFEIKELL